MTFLWPTRLIKNLVSSSTTSSLISSPTATSTASKSTKYNKKAFTINKITQPNSLSNKYIANTGATCHITNSPDYFISSTPCNHTVGVANDKFMIGILVGDICIILALSDSWELPTIFKNILYYKEISYNLFSLDRAV